jgi:hypothetical protein
LGGCAGLKVSPEARGVKRLSIVGLSMNHAFYEAGPSKEEGRALTFKNALKDTAEISSDFVLDEDPAEGDKARREILSHALESYAKAFTAAGWTVVQASVREGAVPEALRPTSYDPALDAAPGLSPVCIDGLTSKAVRYAGRKRLHPPKESAAGLAGLAEGLGLDAVAVVELDMAYRLGSSDLITGYRSGRPDVASAAVVVTKDGAVAVKTTHTSVRRSGPEAPMVRKKGRLLTVDMDNAGQVVDSFNRAVDASAAAFGQELAKELSAR